ncbi:MAG: hypothetical protein ACXWC8_08915 [Limisphaerales bacterium]
MNKTLLAACIATALAATGCLVAEERHGHGHAYGHYEGHSEVIVEHPVIIAPPRPPVLVVRPPEIIIH